MMRIFDHDFDHAYGARSFFLGKQPLVKYLQISPRIRSFWLAFFTTTQIIWGTLEAGMPSGISAPPPSVYGAKKRVTPSAQTTPLQIQARDSISCPAPGNTWIARGQVVLKKDNLIIQADSMDISFEPESLDPKKRQRPSSGLLVPVVSKTVRSIRAKGHVILTHPSGILYSNHVTYNFASEIVYAYGPNIRMHSGPWSLHCSDFLTYAHKTWTAHAAGQVVLTGNNKGLESEKLTARFQPQPITANPQKKPLSPVLSPFMHKDSLDLDVQWVGSTCPIRIWDKGKQYITKSDQAEYDAEHQKITVMGNVRIQYKDQYVHGGQAVMDLNKNTIAIVNGNKGVSALIPTQSFSAKPSSQPSFITSPKPLSITKASQ